VIRISGKGVIRICGTRKELGGVAAPTVKVVQATADIRAQGGLKAENTLAVR